MSGLGLRSAVLHSPASFLSSLVVSVPVFEELVPPPPSTQEGSSAPVLLSSPNFHSALTLHNATVQDPVIPESVVGYSQKQLSHAVDSQSLHHLVVSVQGDRDLARIQSLCLPKAGDWLNAVPVKALGLHLRDVEYSTAIRYRLGLPVFDHSGPCVACGKDSDVLGDHAVGCGSQGERITRHNALRDILFQSAKQALLSPTREERFLITQRGRQNERPGDIVIPSWSSGRDAVIDVSVISPLQSLRVSKAASHPGSALEFRFKQKMDNYLDSCNEAGLHFIPFPVETLGAWHTITQDVIKRIGNAALILARVPSFSPQDVDRDADTDLQ